MKKNRVVWILFLVLAVGAVPVSFAEDAGFEKYRQAIREKIARQKAFLKENPTDAKAYFQLGLALMGLGRHQEEVEAYQEAIRLKADFAEAYDNLSIANDRLHDGARAIRNAIKARQLYEKKKNHRKIRGMQRRLRFLYEKYGYKSQDFETP